jgi:hypothetical protein
MEVHFKKYSLLKYKNTLMISPCFINDKIHFSSTFITRFLEVRCDLIETNPEVFQLDIFKLTRLIAKF